MAHPRSDSSKSTHQLPSMLRMFQHSNKFKDSAAVLLPVTVRPQSTLRTMLCAQDM